MLLPWLCSIIQFWKSIDPKGEFPFYAFVLNNNVLLYYIGFVHPFTTFDPSSYTSWPPNWPISARFLQLQSDACQEVGGSRRMSRIQCAGACGVTAGCQGLSFTCADLHLGSSCRCFVCSAADLGAASTSLEATSGVMTSQVRSSFSLTVRSIPCGKYQRADSTGTPLEQVKGEAKRIWVLNRRLSAVLNDVRLWVKLADNILTNDYMHENTASYLSVV